MGVRLIRWDLQRGLQFETERRQAHLEKSESLPTTPQFRHVDDGHGDGGSDRVTHNPMIAGADSVGDDKRRSTEWADRWGGGGGSGEEELQRESSIQVRRE